MKAKVKFIFWEQVVYVIVFIWGLAHILICNTLFSKKVLDIELFSSYYLSVSLGIMALCISLLHLKRNLFPAFKLFHYFILLFFIATYMFMWRFELNAFRDILICLSAIFIIVYCLYETKKLSSIYIILSISGISMAFYGLFQYIGWLPSSNSLYSFTGTFDNPAGIGMFLGLILPYTFYLISSENHTQIVGVIGYGSVILIITTIILSGSRTGMLAALIGIFILYVRNLRKKQIFFIALLDVLLCIVLYYYKPISANGRFFVTMISWNLFCEHWVLGGGPNAFDTGYMLEQAAFFQQFPQSKWIGIADNMNVPFNEFLHFLIRFGISGGFWLLGFILLLYYWARQNYQNQKRPAMASLCGGIICLSFSYPLSYTLIIFVFVASLCILCMPSKIMFVSLSSRGKYGFMILSLSFMLLIGTGLYQCKNEWQRLQLEERVRNGGESEQLEWKYEIFSKKVYFRHHPIFLYNYALYFYERKEFERALSLLEQCRGYKQDYEWQMTYAYTLKQLLRTGESIEAFQLASNMLPGRLLPVYELMRLYDEAGMSCIAYKCAQQALSIPVKVRSLKTEYIIKEIMNYMSDFNKGKEVLPIEK